MLKPIHTLLAAVLCCSVAFAQVELNPDHPKTYVVQRGDTLWDIAAMFLRDPWLWPEVWHVNPQIDNPHLIYPGDVINLSYVDGRPRLAVQRGERPTVRLSPHVRRSPIGDAIEPIDLQDIRPFLDRRTILDADELVGLPYVVAVQEGHLAGTEGNNIYVRDLDAAPGDVYAVVHPTVVFKETPDTYPFSEAVSFTPVSEQWSYPGGRSIADHIDDFWHHRVLRNYTRNVHVLGYEVKQAGIAEVVASGDPATMLLTSSDIEVMPGDLVIPVFSSNFDLEYVPHGATEVPANTRIIGLSNALFGAGRYQVVAINKGWSQGMEHGHVLSIYRPGRTIRDEIGYPRDDVKTYFSRERRRQATVDLPDEYAGHAMIFKTFENISYALIVRSRQAVEVGDVLYQP